MKNKVSKSIGIMLYALAGVILIYAVWGFIYSTGYIKDMISSGQLTFVGNEFDIVNFYMSNVVQYFISAVLLAAIGFIICSKISVNVPPVEMSSSAERKSNEDNELDLWYKEADDISDIDP